MADEIIEVVVDGPGTVVVTPISDNLEFIEIDYGTVGPRGPAGPQGPPGSAGLTLGDIAYVHTQSAASSTWVITHALTFTPNVTVVDSAGNEQVGTVRYVGQTITITFSGAFSGTAYLS